MRNGSSLSTYLNQSHDLLDPGDVKSFRLSPDRFLSSSRNCHLLLPFRILWKASPWKKQLFISTKTIAFNNNTLMCNLPFGTWELSPRRPYKVRDELTFNSITPSLIKLNYRTKQIIRLSDPLITHSSTTCLEEFRMIYTYGWYRYMPTQALTVGRLSPWLQSELSHTMITPNFRFDSSREIDGDYVKK